MIDKTALTNSWKILLEPASDKDISNISDLETALIEFKKLKKENHMRFTNTTFQNNAIFT